MTNWKRGREGEPKEVQHLTSLFKMWIKTLFGESSTFRETEVNMAGATKLRKVSGATTFAVLGENKFWKQNSLASDGST